MGCWVRSLVSCQFDAELLKKLCSITLALSSEPFSFSAKQTSRRGSLRLIRSVSFTNGSHRIDHIITTLIISGFGKIVIIPMVIWEYNGLHFVANLFTLASNVEATIGSRLLVPLAMVPFLTYLLA